jgi:hypothetical protein
MILLKLVTNSVKETDIFIVSHNKGEVGQLTKAFNEMIMSIKDGIINFRKTEN